MSDNTNTLQEIRQSVKNARGAIESNQVVDKDVHGTLTRIIAKIDAALCTPAPQHNVMGTRADVEAVFRRHIEAAPYAKDLIKRIAFEVVPMLPVEPLSEGKKDGE